MAKITHEEAVKKYEGAPLLPVTSTSYPGEVHAVATSSPYTMPLSAPAMAMQALVKAANDPSVDTAKMRELMEIYERIEARDAERQFSIAMRDAQNEIPKLVKDSKAPDYRYLSLETIGRTVDPITRRHGFAESYGTDDSPMDGHYRVICWLSHTGGHKRVYHADIPADTTGPKGTRTKTGVQGFGSTMSYGRRYLKALIFNLVIVGEDDDGNGGSDRFEGTISNAQIAEIDGLLAHTGRSLERYLKFKDLKSLAQIKARDFERTLEEIRRVAKKDPPKSERDTLMEQLQESVRLADEGKQL